MWSKKSAPASSAPKSTEWSVKATLSGAKGERSTVRVEWTSPKWHSAQDTVALYHTVQDTQPYASKRLGSGAQSGELLLHGDTDGLYDYFAWWPHMHLHHEVRLLTHPDKKCVAKCALTFDEGKRQEELKRLEEVERQYEASMARQVQSVEHEGLKVECTLLTDPVGIDPTRWDHCVRFFGCFTNTSQRPLTLNLRDVHGIGNGRLHLVYSEPLDGPPATTGCPLAPPPAFGEHGGTFNLPGAPRRFGGNQGLVLLQPGASHTQRFVLVSTFYKPPGPGKWKLSFKHKQPHYQGVEDEEPNTQWTGSLECDFYIELR